MTTSNNEALGLAVDGPPSEWIPVKVVGSAVFMSQEGKLVTWHFESDTVQNWEAMGLLAENLAIRKESAPYYYWEYEEEED